MCRLSLSWDRIEDVFGKITEGDPLQGVDLAQEIRGTINDALKAPDLDAFLSVNVETSINNRYIGWHLLKLKINRKHLFNPDTIQELDLPTGNIISNGLVIELITFTNMSKMEVNKRAILTALGANLESISKQVLSHRIKSIKTKYDNLIRNVNKPNGQDTLNLFH